MNIQTHTAPMLFAAGLLLPVAALADTFDFELDLSYQATDQSIALDIPVTVFPTIPPITVPARRVRSSVDTDNVDLSGTWFFSGVTANEGPRSEAAFLSRASSITLGYQRQELSGRTTVRPPPPPTDPDLVPLGTDVSADAYAADLRYVWADSGWYGLASIEYADLNAGFGFGGSSDSYAVGVGKYIADRTSIDLTVRREGDFSDGVDRLLLGARHIGDLGANWQYGAALTLSDVDLPGADLGVGAALSLYPTRSLAFGVNISDSFDGFDDGTRYAVFGSWFPAEAIELSARIGWISGSPGVGGGTTLVDSDEDSVAVGFRYRF